MIETTKEIVRAAIRTRRDVYFFLYRSRASGQEKYISLDDLAQFANTDRMRAALSFGLEMGHVERHSKRYYRLTAKGMLFAETHDWSVEEMEDI